MDDNEKKEMIKNIGLVTWHTLYLLFDLLTTAVFVFPVCIIIGTAYPYNWYIYIEVHIIRILLKYLKRRRYFPRVKIDVRIEDNKKIDLDITVED